jgi:hypothetical protein
MGWIEKQPQDAAEQFLEYAASGRLIEIRCANTPAPAVGLILAAVIAIGFGSAATAIGLTEVAGPAATMLGFVLFVGGVALLAQALKVLHGANELRTLHVRSGAVLPPDLVRKGNWIHRGGAWERVDQVGRDGAGRVHALLGSGDLIELRRPVTVAGDEFRPFTDPVKSLRH